MKKIHAKVLLSPYNNSAVRKSHSALIGQKFGDLVVTGFAASHPKKGIFWWCRCEAEGCSKEVRALGTHLTTGRKVSCGCKSWTAERRAKAAQRMKAVQATNPWTDERRAAVKASWTEGRRAAQAERLRRLWTPEMREAAAAKGREQRPKGQRAPRAPYDPATFWTPERRQEASRRARERMADPGVRERLSIALKAAWTPEKRAELSDRQKARWSPERRLTAKAAAKARWLASPPNRKIDAVEPGAVFGKLTVLEGFDMPPEGPCYRNWLCECSCEARNKVIRRADRLAYSTKKANGKMPVKSCGCVSKKSSEWQVERALARARYQAEKQAALAAEQQEMDRLLSELREKRRTS